MHVLDCIRHELEGRNATTGAGMEIEPCKKCSRLIPCEDCCYTVVKQEKEK